MAASISLSTFNRCNLLINFRTNAVTLKNFAKEEISPRTRPFRIPLSGWLRHSMKNGYPLVALIETWQILCGQWSVPVTQTMRTMALKQNASLKLFQRQTPGAQVSVVNTYRKDGVRLIKDSNPTTICKKPYKLFLAKRFLLTMDPEIIDERTTWESVGTCIFVEENPPQPSREWASILRTKVPR